MKLMILFNLLAAPLIAGNSGFEAQCSKLVLREAFALEGGKDYDKGKGIWIHRRLTGHPVPANTQVRAIFRLKKHSANEIGEALEREFPGVLPSRADLTRSFTLPMNLRRNSKVFNRFLELTAESTESKFEAIKKKMGNEVTAWQQKGTFVVNAVTHNVMVKKMSISEIQAVHRKLLAGTLEELELIIVEPLH